MNESMLRRVNEGKQEVRRRHQETRFSLLPQNTRARQRQVKFRIRPINQKWRENQQTNKVGKFPCSLGEVC